ncbi:MAG TPA: UvrD-helicase domain-containing protein [Patescibacteria group bacterium]|nr:UvrD-helicase domain-containing protein [Patescibacteria group bacterium]
MSMDAEALLEGLNPEQKAAVTHGEGPLLIVAGAGTGKTTVIAKRIAWLIATGKAGPGEILALTFTEKAASEMEERVDKLLPMGYVELWISTFHAFCERILRERGIDVGLPGDFRLLNETGAWLMARQHLAELGLDYYRPLGDPSKFIHDLLKHFSRAKDEVVTPEDYAAFAEKAVTEEAEEKERYQEVARAFAAYQKILVENKALDFGDLIAYSIKLLKERPAVLAMFRKRFKYILVDEFQDTNYAQYELVRLLAGEDGNVTVVGDDDQSIYKFRGASVSNILGFMDDHPKAAQVFLTTNYRSKQEVLDASYLFIKQNDPNRLEHKLSSGKNALSKRLKADRGAGADIVRLTGEDLQAEAETVAAEIRRIKEEDEELAWNDFAILFRANAHAKPFLEALAREGIPHLYVASKGLYAKPVIQDAICYLKLLDNYHESPALFRTLSWKIFGVPEKDLVALSHDARKHARSLWESLLAAGSSFAPETLAAFRKVRALIEKHSERSVRTHPSRLLKEIFVDTGYYADLVSDDAPERLEAIRFLNQFVRGIQSYEEGEPRPTLRGYMRQLDWEIESGEEGSVPFDINEGPETVKLMTAHTSKGLEFPTVFVVQLVDGRFPTRRHHEAIPYPDALVKETLPAEGDPHLEEERRLFYVACTRARDRLYLTGAEDVGGARKKKPSRFLAELDAIEDAKKLMRELRAAAASAFDAEEPAPAESGAYELEMPKDYSFSQLAAYENCPLQYKFAHLLKIPTIDKGQLNFGKTIHAVAEAFIKAYLEKPDAPMSEDDVIALYESLWDGEWYEDPVQKTRFHDAGRAAVKHVRKRTLEERPQPWLVESPFSIKIGPYTVRGKIDRVDKLPDGRAVIIDYKTGKAKDEIPAEMKAQLAIYQLALHDVHGVETADMRFWFVNDDVVTPVEPAKDLEKVRAKLEERITELTTSDFAPTPGEFTCRWCDFKDICKYKVL